jgi:hypothetical protein
VLLSKSLKRSNDFLMLISMLRLMWRKVVLMTKALLNGLSMLMLLSGIESEVSIKRPP